MNSNKTADTLPEDKTDDESEQGSDRGSRLYRRRSILWPAKLWVGKHEFQAQLWNVSLGGAKVRVDIPLKEGACADIQIPAKNIELPTEVVWQSGELLGVKFQLAPERIKDIFDGAAIILGLDGEDSSDGEDNS